MEQTGEGYIFYFVREEDILCSRQSLLSRILFAYMALEPYGNVWPEIDPTAFIAQSVDLIGRVTVGEYSSIWYNTTLRGDINEIVIGACTSIQDNSSIHLADDYGCYVGNYCTIGHSVTLHACTVEDEVLIGMGATILDGVVIGKGSVVGANSLVTKGKIIPPYSIVMGSPAKIVGTIEEENRQNNYKHAEKYVRVAQTYRERVFESRPCPR